MKVLIGADHAGFNLKEEIKAHLEKKGHEIEDYGTHDNQSCDYNDVARTLAEDIARGKAPRGILICGTGIGMSIQANKVKGIRAAHVHDVYSAKATRLHNDSNILTMGGRVIGPELAKVIVDTWLETEFSAEDQHLRRVKKIED